MPHLVSELERLRAALGPETVSMMQAHEAAGTYDHPEYLAAVKLLNYRHVCRLPEWPAPVSRSLADWNMGPYMTMQGPNEFLYIGNLKDWNRIPDLSKISAPVLIVVGERDELTPACALRMKNGTDDPFLNHDYIRRLSGSEGWPHRLIEIESGKHAPFFNNPEAFDAALRDVFRTRS